MKFVAPRCLHWLLLISAVVLFFDRLSKSWVEAHVAMYGAIPVIPGFFRITHWTNEGAAFSLFADSSSPHLVHMALVGFNILAATAVLIAMIWLGNRISLTTIALALVLAGALGNAHDRILYGYVVDFIEIHIFGYDWPDFNIADSSIVTGACLLLLDSLLPHKDRSPHTDSPS